MVKLNEGIAKIKKGSTLESLYNRLKVGMEASANEKLPDWTSMLPLARMGSIL